MLNIRCTGQQVQMQTVDHEVGPRNMDGWPVIDLNFTETVDRDKSGTGTEYRNEKEDITAWLIHIQHISNYPLQIFCFLLKNNKRKKKLVQNSTAFTLLASENRNEHHEYDEPNAPDLMG